MYLIQTVQTSWRPQLPLPKELQIADERDDETLASNPNDMERLRHGSTTSSKKDKDNASLHASSQLSNASNSSKNTKWSFGRFFRKKKEVVTDSSSEEDRKAGFVPAQKYPRSSHSKPTKPKSKSGRSSKLNGAGFDHIVNPPPTAATATAPATQQQPQVDHEFFLPVETVPVSVHKEPYYQNQQPQQLQPQSQSQSQYLTQQQPLYSRSSNSLDRRAARVAAHKSRSTQRLPHGGQGLGLPSSSEEELISLNSSTFSKYRSDESIHSGGQALVNGQNSRRSRAARNERYYKRLSRDGEVSHGGVPVMYAPQPVQRWKTQPVPLSIYNGPPPQHLRQPTQHLLPAQGGGMRNTSSLQHVAPYVQWGQLQHQQPPKQLQNSVNDTKRSISYDSHIHLQNVGGGRVQTKPLPPPPPPRDPLRRVHVGGSGHLANGSASDLRPISYAFDKNGLPTSGLKGRCVSDDKIWASQMPHYQSAHSLNVMPNLYSAHAQQKERQDTPPVTQHSRRFITRAERDAMPAKQSLPNGIDFHYITDSTPRSRKPIHMLEQQQQSQAEGPPPSSGILRTTKNGLPSPSPTQTASDFWKHLDGDSQRRGRVMNRPSVEAMPKPRSISSSRAGELRSYPIPMYSEVYKPTRKPSVTSKPTTDEVDNVICGSLHIKPGQDTASNYVEIRHKDVNKSNSMPNHYQRRSAEIPTTPNKYDEYVAEKREKHNKPIFNPPTPPQRKLSIPPPNAAAIYFPRKKPANLEEAINELEAIYKSLGLSEETEKKERIPTPNEFEKFALAHADEYDDDDSPSGEPDPVRDDVAYRNIQLANLQHKTVEKQPPFGIPIGPIVPAPQTDYLHVTPIQAKVQVVSAPDIVKDDLAVRALRKDPPGPKERFIYPVGSLQKKNRATRTQSANIYSLIQRDAAKPSGGDMYSYMELSRNIDRAGSMSDLHKDADTTADIPTTLTLLRNLKEQEQQAAAAGKKSAHIPFRHPSQGGAICQLPTKLSSPGKEDVPKAPVPLPRKSLTPDPILPNHHMEDALNQIAKEAQESSVKLTKELQELRKGALITAARPKVNTEEEKLEKDLQEIEAVSEAAKRCGKMLLDTLPDAHVDAVPDDSQIKARKLHKEGKLIQAIDQVSEAANAVCEKILKDIVTTEPPVIVQEAVKVKNKPVMEPLVMPNLIKKLDPIQSEKIEAIAQRCMRQLSELADQPDYDNLLNQDEGQPTSSSTTSTTAVACNANHTNVLNIAQTVDSIISNLAEAKPQPEIEEIDKIMQECEAKARTHAVTEKPPTGVHFPLNEPKMHAFSSSNSGSTTNTTNVNNNSMTTSSTSSSSNHAAPAASSTTASSFSSSSDCLAKSSSPSASRRFSSSITSFNPYSSSDYIKSPSSEYHAPSTDPIKTFSTTSYDQSTSATPNITTNSTFSYTPSPPLNLTPKSVRANTSNAAAAAAAAVAVVAVNEAGARQSEERGRSSSPSQYNSSEELAMIFGIEEKPKQMRRKLQQQQLTQQQQSQQKQQQMHISGKIGTANIISDANINSSSNNHALSATTSAASVTVNACASDSNHTNQLTNPENVECKFHVDSHTSSNLNATNPTSFNVITNAPTTTPTISPTNASCKLATIPETQTETPKTTTKREMNKLYASKVNILMDRAVNVFTRCDSSLSSLEEEEEISSNPDSGNASLADYPLTNNANVCLQLHSACNSRYAIRNTFVSEVRIPNIEQEAVAVQTADVSCVQDFPPLPTAEELLDSLRETDKHEQTTTVDRHTADSISEVEAEKNEEVREELGTQEVRKTSVVYETPQLNMSISEVRLNYEFNESELNKQCSEQNELNEDVLEPKELTEQVPEETASSESISNQRDSQETEPKLVLTQIRQCTNELEQLNAALDEMPRRRATTTTTTTTTTTMNENRTLSLLPWSDVNNNNTNNHRNDDNNNNNSNNSDNDSSTCSDNRSGITHTLSLFGEPRNAMAAARAGAASTWTTLEHVLVACSLGVITANDLFTLCLIVIGVITVIAIVLF